MRPSAVPYSGCDPVSFARPSGRRCVDPWATAPTSPLEHSDDQAHLPAEQPPAPQEARLPPPHAHACGSLNPLVASAQGSGLSHGLSRTVLPADRRLRRSGDFTTVLRGRRSASRTVVVHAVAAAHPDQPRFGLVVSKAVGGSVVRHRVSRRIRHAIAVELAAWDAVGLDVVVRALPSAAAATSSELASDLRKCRSGVSASRLSSGVAHG